MRSTDLRTKITPIGTPAILETETPNGQELAQKREVASIYARIVAKITSTPSRGGPYKQLQSLISSAIFESSGPTPSKGEITMQDMIETAIFPVFSIAKSRDIFNHESERDLAYRSRRSDKGLQRLGWHMWSRSESRCEAH